MPPLLALLGRGFAQPGLPPVLTHDDAAAVGEAAEGAAAAAAMGRGLGVAAAARVALELDKWIEKSFACTQE